MANRLLIFMVVILAVLSTAAITTLVVKDSSDEGEASNGASIIDTANAASVSSASSAELEKAVGAYINANPEAIVNAFTRARTIQEAKEARVAEKNIGTRKNDLERDANTPFFGNPDGDVTIVKFSDFNCGFCKRVVPDIAALLAEDKNIRFVIKDFPIMGERSNKDAKASLAAFKINPEKYFDFYKAVMKKSPRTDAQLLALAETIGIDPKALKAEMKKPIYDAQLQKHLALGQSIGVRGTPAFIIDGKFVRGAISLQQFRNKVAEARAAAK